MPQLTCMGSRANYLEQGSGVPIVMLHAGGLSGKQWAKVAAELGTGFRVVAPDLWGFGQTEAWKRTEKLSHFHQAGLVAEMIEQLELGTSHLVGHSYGGATAVALALNRNDLVKTLVLIEPILTTLLKRAGEDKLYQEYSDMAHSFLDNVASGDLERAWRRFIDYRNGSGAWDKLPQEARQRMLAMTAATVAGFEANLSNPITLSDLGQIRVSTLVLCGEKTTAPDRRVTEIVRDGIGGSRYKTIPGADHMSPLTQPDLWPRRSANISSFSSGAPGPSILVMLPRRRVPYTQETD